MIDELSREERLIDDITFK